MNRRAGQAGTIVEIGNQVRVRFRIDVAGQEEREYKSVAICPRYGEGRLPEPVIQRKAKQIVEEYGANSEQRFKEVVLGSSVTFGVQADAWLAANNLRSDYETAKGAVENWLNPTLKGVPLENCHNGTMKTAVEKMKAAKNKNGSPRLSAKTIRNYLQFGKQIVASFVDPKSLEPIYTPKWSNKAMGVPKLIKSQQRRPSLLPEEVNHLLECSQGWFRVLLVICFATGMRISEALAIEVRHLKNDCRTIVVQQQVDRKSPELVDRTKTPAGLREVDVHSKIAQYIKNYLALSDIKQGLLFASEAGTPRMYSNVAERQLEPALEAAGIPDEPGQGFHIGRRFRSTVLDEQNCKSTLRKFWSGWQGDQQMDEIYSQIKRNLSARLAEAERVGYGFKIPALGLVVGPKRSKTAVQFKQLEVAAD
jgi:integrase